MKFKNETIYIKAKSLHHLINESINSTTIVEARLTETLFKRSLQIPMQVGLGLNSYSAEIARFRLGKAEKNLDELAIAIDLNTSKQIQIDYPNLIYW